MALLVISLKEQAETGDDVPTRSVRQSGNPAVAFTPAVVTRQADMAKAT